MSNQKMGRSTSTVETPQAQQISKTRTVSTTSIQSQGNQQIPAVSNIMCRTIPCSLSNLNADSLDWSSTDFLSFGCQNIVVICHFAHGKHLLQLQTLHRHKSAVNRTAWPEIVNDWAPARSVNLKTNRNDDDSQKTNTFSDQKLHSIDDIDDSGLIRLASSDVYGTIIIWNMLDAAVLAQISTPPECLSKTIIDMKWISCSRRPRSSSSSFVSSNNYNYILVLYSSSVLALYETEIGDTVWLKNFNDQEARGFVIDPFDSTRLLISRRLRQQSSNFTAGGTHNRTPSTPSPESTFYLVDNIDCDKPPSGPSLEFELRRSTIDRKESISSSSSTRLASRTFDRVGGFFLNVTSYSLGHVDHNNRSNRRLASHSHGEYMSSLSVLSQQCSFNPAVRNQVILLVNRELVVIDLEFEIILYIINIERNIADISCFYPCRQRNLFITLHESGSIAARLLQKEKLDLMPELSMQTDEIAKSLSHQQFEIKTHRANDSPIKSDSELFSYSYHSICQSEILRQTRQGKICGFKVSPVDETRIALLMSNGKITIHQLCLINRIDWTHKTQQDCSSFSTKQRTAAIHRSRLFDTLPFLNELINVNDYYNNQIRDKKKYQLLMAQMLGFLDSQPTAIRMGPPATVRNWRFHKPLLAIGNISGTVQVFNLSTGYLYRELGVHSCSVKGIEWVCLNAFISYAYSDPSPQTGELSWELCVTDIETGKTVQLKAGRNNESSIIQSVKVSHLRQYFIIVFRDEPFEIWDLENLSLLRLVSKKFTGIVAAEWSPLYSKRIEEPLTTKTQSHGSDDPTLVASVETANTSDSKKSVPAAPIRENFVVTNKMGELFHFSIAGSVVKEMSRIPPETTMTGAATAVAWKSDHVVLGDGDGNISVWDLKQRESRTEATMRGSIRKIRFAPGRGNMKILLLFEDGVDIWDMRSLRRLTNIKSPRDHLFKVCDIDWAGSDRPVILTSDGLIIVTDLEFKQFSSPLKKLHLSESMDKSTYLFDYHLLHPGDRYVFRTMHYHNHEEDASLFHYQQSLPISQLEKRRLTSTATHLVNNEEKNNKTVGVADGRAINVNNNNLLINARDTSKLLAGYESHAFWQMVNFMLNRRRLQDVDGSDCERIHSDRLLGDTSLDTMFDLYLDCDSFVQLQIERASLLGQRKNTHRHYIKLYELLIVLGQKKQAANILLETEPTSEKECQQYLLDSFRACLTETLRISSSECDKAFPMIKLVATNLIAAGNLYEGCQLLNLIDRSSDACHYLVSASRWYDAVRLAKLRLSNKAVANVNCNNKNSIIDSTNREVISKWCDHLISNNQINTALLALLSLEEFVKVIDLLVCIGDIERAAILTRICLESTIDPGATTPEDHEQRQEQPHIIDSECTNVTTRSLSREDKENGCGGSAVIGEGSNEQYDYISNKIDNRVRLDVLNSEVAYKAVQRYYYTLKDFNMTTLQDEYRQLLQLFSSNANNSTTNEI